MVSPPDRGKLQPVARLCVKRSIKFQDFLAAAKLAFVEAAQTELREERRPETVSRLSLMTGLQRLDISRLNRGETEEQKSKSILSRIIAQWLRDRRFLTGDRKPRALQYEGRESEFASLVHSVSRELNAYTVLFELDRLGLVKKTPRGVKLTESYYVASKDLGEGMRMAGGDISDLLGAVVENSIEMKETICI